MKCEECKALENGYRTATEHYTAVLSKLQETLAAKPDEHREITLQVEVARGVCLMTDEALRVHREKCTKELN
jgi:hypothetical protein